MTIESTQNEQAILKSVKKLEELLKVKLDDGIIGAKAINKTQGNQG